jgi:Pyruvate/2-oxoacid:ferredoxin oxidoreductase delta subunit
MEVPPGIACVCRKATLGQEKRYCYGVSLGPDGGELGRIFAGIDNSFLKGVAGAGLERLDRLEAVTAFRAHEKEGMCHTVWTFGTPFIGGICNCDRSDCLAMRATVTHSTPVMFRAEWVARVDPALCTGCRECMRLCPFGAIIYSPSVRKTAVDLARCYGCGICRAACKRDAIHLDDRNAVPAAAGLW